MHILMNPLSPNDVYCHHFDPLDCQWLSWKQETFSLSKVWLFGQETKIGINEIDRPYQGPWVGSWHLQV